MPDYKEKMLILLADKYRKSKKDSGTNKINRKTRIKPTELYKNYKQNDADIGQIEAVNRAAEECREMGFLTYEMNGFSNEIAHIELVDERILQVEQYLSQHYHYESKGEKVRYVEQMIARYCESGPVAKQECEKLKAQLKKNRVPAGYLETEDILRALEFIEPNQKLLYIREASMLIYGTSKYFEENTLDRVCRLLRAYLKKPCAEDELPDEILSEYHIVKEKQKLCLKGRVTLVKDKGRIELEHLSKGAEFYADELEEIRQILVHVPRLITVENKTSYLRCQSEDTVFFYLGGYANRSQRDFLRLVYQDNPSVEYRHFGDIDAGGFYIHEHLCRVTGIPFGLYQMSIEQLQDQRYKACLQELTDHDRRRLKSLAQQESYQEVVQYMLEKGVKLEQEIVSLG